ncbi:MAG: Unknown protein [uncultured Sulfurovum sp.]|uniref:Uncharacterized protein n=1 Tax=uncultured Sulfurovum sp. TaxID=269237 RepID=A0A6S6UH74_9BACT|nr:MAG: Unknown protein [uncultured Sulfurovum sp.]
MVKIFFSYNAYILKNNIRHLSIIGTKMIPAQLHAKLMDACRNANIDEVKQCLDNGAEPNFNLQTAINALDTAISIDNHQIITLLLEHGATVKESVLQRAIEKEKNYLHLLIPNFKACQDEALLTSVLQAAININDFDLAQQAVHQGAKPRSMLLYTIKDFGSTNILELLIEDGFDIHADKNMLLTEWMGSCLIGEWGRRRSKRKDFLVFIADYYLKKPKSIEKFKSWRRTDKSRLFRMGLDSNNLNMMKFAFLIGVDKNEVLNSALFHYYGYQQGSINSTHSPIFKNDNSVQIVYEIIEYMLNSNIKFSNLMISNAVCFKYTELLDALSHMDDLEYAYEMAFKYKNNDLLNYFVDQGVSKEAQCLAKMRVSAIQGNIKELRKAINDGANIKMLSTDTIVEIINKNQVESLKCLYDSGLLFDNFLNLHLNHAMNNHQAYESISYLIELGLNITHIENIPLEYKIQYPYFADMWKKRFTNIFDYTVYLAKEVYPKAEGKQQEEILQTIAELSSLPYVMKMSKEKSLAES